MTIAIPVFAMIKSDQNGLTFHMESLCFIGLTFGLVSLILSLVVLVEFPKSSND
jgi:hypothetical protein